jgi:hypothetical protein
MDRQELRTAIAELEHQLSTSTLDAESREVLEQTLQDIRAALKEQTTVDQQRQTLVGRLRLAVERFEGTHPTLTGTLMRLVDGLGEMGI